MLILDIILVFIFVPILVVSFVDIVGLKGLFFIFFLGLVIPFVILLLVVVFEVVFVWVDFIRIVTEIVRMMVVTRGQH